VAEPGSNTRSIARNPDTLLASEAVDASQFCAWVEGSPWQFAKTMPKVPHEYTLRRKQADELAFEQAVQFIREHGWRKRWGRYHHHYWNAGAWKYWTMGAPVAETVLVNRALLEPGDPGFNLGLVAAVLGRVDWPPVAREVAGAALD
jgi:hypothetical protein